MRWFCYCGDRTPYPGKYKWTPSYSEQPKRRAHLFWENRGVQAFREPFLRIRFSQHRHSFLCCCWCGFRVHRKLHHRQIIYARLYTILRRHQTVHRWSRMPIDASCKQVYYNNVSNTWMNHLIDSQRPVTSIWQQSIVHSKTHNGSNGIYARQNRKNGLGITKNLLSGIELE